MCERRGLVDKRRVLIDERGEMEEAGEAT